MTVVNRYPPGPGRTGALAVLAGLHHDPTAVMLDLQRDYGDLVHFAVGPQRVFVVMSQI